MHTARPACKAPIAQANMTFANQVAVITGASSGIGHAMARQLAAEGCKVGLVARRAEQLAALASTIEQAGGTAAWATADMTDRAATVAAIRDLAVRLGPIDLLVANAGVGAPTVIEPQINVGDVEKMLRVNVLGVVYCLEAVLPDMLQRGSGHIAAVSSLAAYTGMPGEWGYTASKAALNNLMNGLRVQLRGRGIAVTTLCPGFVLTPMTEVNDFKMPWVLEADAAARKMIKAIRRRKKVYNFPWQTTFFSKLMSWLPDWMLARTMRKYMENPPFPKQPL